MIRSDYYVEFDSGLEMESRFLTENVAYFLGGIFASEEEVETRDGHFRIAPVRYNYQAASEMEITKHFEYIKEIADQVKGTIVTADNIKGTRLDSGKNKMPGFSTFFKVRREYGLIELIPPLKQALLASPWSVHRAFLVGMFDGRSSPDIDRKTNNIRYLVLDCISDEVGAFLDDMVEAARFQHNYNTHRDRVEGGRPRNPQLRIKDVEKFMERVGLISPRRLNLLRTAYMSKYYSVELHDESAVLPGLKTLIMG